MSMHRLSHAGLLYLMANSYWCNVYFACLSLGVLYIILRINDNNGAIFTFACLSLGVLLFYTQKSLISMLSLCMYER